MKSLSAKIFFVKRSKEEIDMFGGEIYAELDGKKVATISLSNAIVNVTPGRHKIKMYKSHSNYNSLIGFAETEINISENETLVIKYHPPLTVNQPGNIVVSDFESFEKIEQEVRNSAMNYTRIKNEEDEKNRRQDEENEKVNKTIFLLAIGIPAIGFIFWLIYDLILFKSIF